MVLKKKKLYLAIFIIFIMIFDIVCVSPMTIYAATVNQNNIVGWANYYYNIMWTAKRNVNGWRNRSTFYQGQSYHIPYVQAVDSGAYIGDTSEAGYGITVDGFMSSVNSEGSAFYTYRSTYNAYGYESVYYGMDCSSFVSSCWGIPRTTTYGIPGYSTKIGELNYSNINNLELGDAINSNPHVVLVTGLTRDSSGSVISIEITEQTPPELTRDVYTPSELINHCSGYTIYRYYGDVPTPPSSHNPIGYVDIIEGVSGKIRVTGWAYDPDNKSAALNIHIYVGGPAGEGEGHSVDINGKSMIANMNYISPDQVYGCGQYHGFDVTIPTSKTGKQRVYVYAINKGEGNNSILPGVEYYDYSSGKNPNGYVDIIEGSPGKIRVTGWTYDPDSLTTPLNIHIYVGGPAGEGEGHSVDINGKSMKANLQYISPDQVYGCGQYHGFDVTIPTNKKGTQRVYVYAINIYGGTGNSILPGVEAVYIPVGENPNGYVDIIEGYSGKIRVTGWAYDPDDTSVPLNIHIYIGGPAGEGEGYSVDINGKTMVANLNYVSPDLVYGCGQYHGFDVTVPTGRNGTHRVYVYAINTGGGTGNSILPGVEAVYIPVSYSVKYDANGGTGTIPSQIKATGENLTLSKVQPIRQGYIFNGWSTVKGSNKIEYLPGSLYKSNSNVTLYAVWRKIGDINADGKINDIDAALILKHLSNQNEIAENELIYADVNYDGSIDLLDAAMLQSSL